MKKYIWIFISILFSSLVLIIINNLIYGTETIWIANYMPPLVHEPEPWIKVKLIRTIKDMLIPSGVCVVVTAIISCIFYKKNVFKKDLKSLILIFVLFILPIIISGIILSTKYGFTC
ncbi:MAG: hypothetical protein E7310_03105 [Clostridiales bacterium]|nr:hypothetical protein [Clostridiales bacterium]